MSKRVTLFPSFKETLDNISFSHLTEQQAEALAFAFAFAFAFAKEGFYVKTWDTTDVDIKHCVNIKLQKEFEA